MIDLSTVLVHKFEVIVRVREGSQRSLDTQRSEHLRLRSLRFSNSRASMTVNDFRSPGPQMTKGARQRGQTAANDRAGAFADTRGKHALVQL